VGEPDSAREFDREHRDAAGAGEAGRRVRALYDLKIAPFHMAAKGMKLWLFAEIDNLRLSVKRLFAGKRAKVPVVEEMPAEET
jgi:hypothetical protein